MLGNIPHPSLFFLQLVIERLGTEGRDMLVALRIFFETRGMRSWGRSPQRGKLFPLGNSVLQRTLQPICGFLDGAVGGCGVLGIHAQGGANALNDDGVMRGSA